MKQNKKGKALKENVASWNGSRSGEDFLCKKFLNCTEVINGNERIAGSSAKEIGQVKSFRGYYKWTQKKQIFQGHFKFEPMWLLSFFYVHLQKCILYIIISSEFSIFPSQKTRKRNIPCRSRFWWLAKH